MYTLLYPSNPQDNTHTHPSTTNHHTALKATLCPQTNPQDNPIPPCNREVVLGTWCGIATNFG